MTDFPHLILLALASQLLEICKYQISARNHPTDQIRYRQAEPERLNDSKYDVQPISLPSTFICEPVIYKTCILFTTFNY